MDINALIRLLSTCDKEHLFRTGTKAFFFRGGSRMVHQNSSLSASEILKTRARKFTAKTASCEKIWISFVSVQTSRLNII